MKHCTTHEIPLLYTQNNTKKITKTKTSLSYYGAKSPNYSVRYRSQMAESHREEEQVNLLGEEGLRAGGAQNLKLG